MKNINIVLFIMLILVGLSTGILSYQSLKIQEKNQQLLSRLINGQTSNVSEDPYLKRQVKNTIVKHFAPIQRCYNQMLSSQIEKTSGKVVIDWQIDEKGKVLDPGIIRSPSTHPLLMNA